MRLADVSIGLNRLREAREELQGMVDIFPALAQNGLGEIALRERRFEDAVRHFRAALERAPQASAIHYSLAMAYRGLGRVDEARSHLEQRGAAGIKLGDPIVDSLQSLVRGERGLVAQGRKAYEVGRYQEAADAFARAVEAAPNSAAARVNLGLTQLQLGNADAAVAHLRAASNLAPDDPEVSRDLLRVLLLLGRDDDAILVLRKSSSAKPDDEETLVSLAILLASKERFGEAPALLDDAQPAISGAYRDGDHVGAIARVFSRPLDSATAVERSISRRRFTRRNRRRCTRETVALALAELERCDEALAWMKRAVAGAEQGRTRRRRRDSGARCRSTNCRRAGREADHTGVEIERCRVEQ